MTSAMAPGSVRVMVIAAPFGGIICRVNVLFDAQLVKPERTTCTPNALANAKSPRAVPETDDLNLFVLAFQPVDDAI